MVPLHSKMYGKCLLIDLSLLKAQHGGSRPPPQVVFFFISPFVKSGDLRMKSLVRISGEQL